MRIFFYFSIIIFVFSLKYKEAITLETRFTVNDPQLLDVYDEKNNIFIIDFRKNDNSKKLFKITCLSGPESLDLNLTFTGFNSTIRKVNFF